MPFYGEWRRALDEKCRLDFPAKICRRIGSPVFISSTSRLGGIRIFPHFKPPKGKERMFREVDVKPHETSYSVRMRIDADARKQFRLRGIKPGGKVLLVGRGDHLELYPAGSRR